MDNPHRSAFRYKPLRSDVLGHEIRLLKLRPKDASVDTDSTFACEMVHANIEDGSNYKALSYTWGDATDGTRSILINGFVVEIRINLFHALLHIQKRHHEEILLWVDAVCIDQSNVEERNRQVSRMHSLYGRAEQVILWLGLEADDSKKAIEFVERLYSHIEEIPSFWATLTFSDIRENFTALSKLLSRSYWERVWVVQELMAGKDIIVQCGQDNIPWTHLIQVQRAYFDKQVDVARCINTMFGSDPKNVTLVIPVYIEGPRSVHRSQTALTSGWTLFDTLKYYLRAKKATDPRDMIYAFSSAAGVAGQEITIDYNQSVAELYTHFTRSEILRTAKLDMWGAISERQYKIPDLPSWVVDWSFDVKDHVFLFDPSRVGPDAYLMRFDAAAGSKANVSFEGSQHIKVSGIQVGTIDVLCETVNRSVDSSDSLIMPGLQEWSTMLLSRTKDTEEQVLQLGRTLIADCLTLLRKDQFDSRLYYALLGKLVRKAQSLTSVSESPAVLTRCAETTLTGVTEQEDEQFFWFYSYISRFIMSGRRLFFNRERDTMGVCPSTTEIGDLLVIPHGCPFVMVLRSGDDGTLTIVGPAYMDGFMYGHAITLVERGELDVEDFVIQ